ncbi:hypothetical protein U9M48_022145 [Paspalum notatum var. saurae]|uniref:Reverse transcriptase zinc-binding domain-containing protein n=1 Tax=Paspalum notatum var. saurae TaxID=547442 RepID=A0AAQ3WTE7_PASNO
MRWFSTFINDLELSELVLTGRRFTWSNRREHPTLERLDRVLVTSDWLVMEYVDIWEKTQGITLSDQPDSFIWRWSPDRCYSSSSAYAACFQGSIRLAGATLIWRAKVPPKDSETMNHLLLYCPYTKELWFRLLNPVGLGNLVPTDQLLFVDWWTRLRKSVAKDLRKGVDAFVLLTAWVIWKERNQRTFRRTSSSIEELLSKFRVEAESWALAGYAELGRLTVPSHSRWWSS